MRIVAIYRQDKALTELIGSTRIEPGDEVFVLAATGTCARCWVHCARWTGRSSA